MMLRKQIAWAVMVLSLLCGAGSLVLFAAFPLGSLSERRNWPDALVLSWGALLSFAFFVQHSGMVRRRFRARLSAVIPAPYHRAFYSIASGIVLAAVLMLWQPSSTHLLVLGDAYLWATRLSVLVAVGIFVWGAVAAGDIDFFGLNAIRADLRHGSTPEPVFMVRGPYRWMRHPWYFGVIVLIWSVTDLTADRLLFNVLWTGWICLGAVWEEADLTAEFGEPYARYRRRTPMLIPWRGPVGQ